MIDLGYRARDQFQAFHARKQRWACLVCHRRAGKTVACVMDLIDAALRDQTGNARFAYIAPHYVQAKDVAWSYVKQYTRDLPDVRYNEAELQVRLHTGAVVRLYGADNFDRMRGIFLDGVILDEAADMHPRAWPEVIRPALADRKGWAVFIGTPKGRNSFFDTWEFSQTSPDWFALMLKASETGIVDEEELADARAMMTPEQYAQEWECSFDAAIMGAYYAKEIAEARDLGHVCDLPLVPGLPVHSAWDLGMGDSTAIWCFQIVGNEVRFLDHIENHSQPLSYYVSELEARGYKGTDFVPHDAKVRELGTGRSRIETLQSLGRTPQVVPAHTLMDGINATRVSFGQFWFDRHKCHQGLEALLQYRADYDEKERVFRDKPKHDWTSHTADAMRYAAMAWREMRADRPKPKPKHLVLTATATGGLTSNMDLRERIDEMIKRKRRAANG